MAIALFDANVTKSLFMFPQKQNKTLKQGSISRGYINFSIETFIFFQFKEKIDLTINFQLLHPPYQSGASEH